MFRTTATVFLITVLTSSAFASGFTPLSDSSLRLAAEFYKQGNYDKAAEAADKASDCGMKEFIVGRALYRQKNWQPAATHLEKAARDLPLVADYSLYYLGDSLYQLGRYEEAAASLQKLLKEHPSSPMARAAEILRADALFAMKRTTDAHEAYQKFIERYASGSDALHAAFQAALCRRDDGHPEKAVLELHAMRISNPDTAIAANAEEELRALAAAGIPVPQLTVEDSVRIGNTLFDRKKYDQAVAVFRPLTSATLATETRSRIALKTGQALFRSRKYREAEAVFSAMRGHELDRTICCETGYWLARTLDKQGKENDAFTAYLKLAETYPDLELSHEALMQAGFVRKFQGKPDEARKVFERIVNSAVTGSIKARALWELAWGAYLAADYKVAANLFRQLTETDGYREKSLYWQAKALHGGGDTEAAGLVSSRLIEEFPRGFYALQMRVKNNSSTEDSALRLQSEPAMAEKSGMPSGFDRVKVLISLGMYEEARKELQMERKKADRKGHQLAIVRLYQAMDDYYAPLSIVSQGALGKIKRSDPLVLGLSYPLAYRDIVTKYSSGLRLSPSLVYSLIRAESQFNANAVSPVGARGLMQLMPSTAKAVDGGSRSRNPAVLLGQPEYNIRLGTRHLKDLLKYHNGNLVSAIAAYNAGSTAVERWRKAFGHLREDEFIENIPYAETREYVKKVLATADLYDQLYKLDSSQPLPSPATPDIPDVNEQNPTTEQAGAISSGG